MAWSAPACRRPPRPPSDRDGVVVEAADAAGAGARGGVQPGDRLLAWEIEAGRPEAKARRGRFGDALDVAEVEVEEAPRGRVRLLGERGGRRRTWALPAGAWRLRPAPRLTPQRAAREADLHKRLAAADAAAMDGAAALVRELQNEGRWREAAAVWLRLGEAAAQAGLQRDAGRAFDAARALAAAAGSAAVEARAWEVERVAFGRLDRKRALAASLEALRLRRTLAAAGETLALADAQIGVALAAFRLREFASAEGYGRSSLAIRERLAPGSLQAAESLSCLGALANARGDGAAAFAFHGRALAIRETLAPASVELAATLVNLGNAVRSDPARAEPYYRRAVDLLERVTPDGLDAAYAFNSLGVLCQERGDLPAAETYLRRALALFEKHDPAGWATADCLNNLGLIARDGSRFEDARDYYRRALEIGEKINPQRVAVYLSNLGSAVALLGDGKAAQELLERALRLHRKTAPGSLALANTLFKLGSVAAENGRRAEAAARHAEALKIRSRLAPGSALEAQSLREIAVDLRRRGRKQAALRLWLRAVKALERRRDRLTTSERSAMGFGARYGHVYQELVELMVELGRREEAFQMLERSRARSFVALLAQRDLVFSGADVPAELLRRQRQVDAEYNDVQASLQGLDAERDGPRIDVLLTRLEQIAARRTELAEAVGRASPRLAALQRPGALDAAAARRALDRGTLLLSYSVGRQQTLLFALRAAGDEGKAPGLAVFVLPVGEQALRRRVEIFRAAIGLGAAASAGEAFVAPARALFDDLLGPARPLLRGCRRLLIVPDGPLHALPFAALIGPGQPARPLVESVPLHVAASATVYAELRKRRAVPSSAGPTLVAFGDPVYDGARAGELRSGGPTRRAWITARALRLDPLPRTRVEVEFIRDLFPGQAVTYLGAEATEERARALGPGPRLIHFACHGLVDRGFPLDSALALSRPGPGSAENGLLQAWEIFERMRIDADLVALSACDTGVGRDMGGEGLVGLTRAFQYAGARSVLASLWPVSDRSTAELMTRFYAELKRGAPKDQALQAAQLALWRRPGGRHPFHWAAFQLHGGWN